MADNRANFSSPIDEFFIRCGLSQQAHHDCHVFLQTHFPGRRSSPTQTQGYCSYTVCIDNIIVQFRPPRYGLDLNITAAAKNIYGTYAPSTAFLGIVHPHGLFAYTMDKMRGVCFKSFIMRDDIQASSIRRTLSEDFALFLARSWHHRGEYPFPAGVIGTSIPSRLKRLSEELPERFRSVTRHTISQLDLIATLPKVLAHGDIVPSNIMLEPSTGHLVGLVDWTEAEVLPFGICLYGLEEILGYVNNDNFVYHADAEQARAAFWTKLYEKIPELVGDQMNKAIQATRVLGILLWHGFAFDDGAIDRVVEDGRDHREVCYLDRLLCGLKTSK